MTGSEILTAPRLIFFDRHIRIAISNNLYLVPFLCENLKLFVSPRCPYLLVITREALASINERAPLGTFDIFDISHSF